MLKGPLCSSSSESLYDDPAMTLIVDDNSNYKKSPQNVFPTDTTMSSLTVPSMTVPNITAPVSSSDISNGSSGCTNSSDGYPRSAETSSDNDNQCVPCIDFEEELASRAKYYSDFTIDRQLKIDNMSSRASSDSKCSDSGSATEELTREVEGCEASDLLPPRVPPLGGASDRDFRVNPVKYVPSSVSHSTSGTDSSSIPSPTSYRRRRSRRMRSDNRSSSSGSSRKSVSIPQASSTMIEDVSPQSSHSSTSSKHRSRSIPQASSTMIEDLPSSKTSSRASSAEDLVSVYTWSIHDNSDVCLEDSYLRNVGQKVVSKPPLPRSSASSRSSSASRKSVKRDRNSNQIEHVLPEPLSMLSDSLTVIEHVTGYLDNHLGASSLYEDDELQFKGSTLPRTSTRVNLMNLVWNKSSGSSSMEARCSSMPDMLSVCTPNDFHSVPNSDEEDSADDSAGDASPLKERPAIQGKSTSSGSPDAQPDEEETLCRPRAPNNTDVLIDSILTDSPTSVGSSGIAAPFNSYNSPDSHPASRASHSTSDNHSESSHQPSAPPSSVVSSPAVAAPSKDADFVFKKPVHTQSLRKIFKFKRNKGKSTEKIATSTPCQNYPSSVRSDPLSKRKLFVSGVPRPQEVQLMDKKAVIKKFRKFSETFHKKDRSGLVRIQTLANL